MELNLRPFDLEADTLTTALTVTIIIIIMINAIYEILKLKITFHQAKVYNKIVNRKERKYTCSKKWHRSTIFSPKLAIEDVRKFSLMRLRKLPTAATKVEVEEV